MYYRFAVADECANLAPPSITNVRAVMSGIIRVYCDVRASASVETTGSRSVYVRMQHVAA